MHKQRMNMHTWQGGSVPHHRPPTRTRQALGLALCLVLMPGAAVLGEPAEASPAAPVLIDPLAAYHVPPLVETFTEAAGAGTDMTGLLADRLLTHGQINAHADDGFLQASGHSSFTLVYVFDPDRQQPLAVSVDVSCPDSWSNEIVVYRTRAAGTEWPGDAWHLAALTVTEPVHPGSEPHAWTYDFDVPRGHSEIEINFCAVNHNENIGHRNYIGWNFMGKVHEIRIAMQVAKGVQPGDAITLGPVTLREPRGAVRYQWYFNDEPMEGATGSALDLEDITADDIGLYHVLVDDERDITPVESTRVALLGWPLLQQNLPARLQTEPGDAVTLGPVALRDPHGAVRYQWFFNGEPIEGATGTILEIADVTTDHLGIYFARVDDDLKATPAESTHLTLLGWPLLLTDLLPERQAEPGEAVTLGPATLRDPRGPVRYQWFFDGKPIERATGATLEIADVTADHLGTYFVRVDDDLKATPAESTHLALLGWTLLEADLPAEQHVEPGETVTLGPATLRDPRGPVRYQWFFNGEPIERATGATLEIADVTADHLGTYFVRVDDDLKATPAESTHLALLGWPLLETDLPAELHVEPGDSAVLGPAQLRDPRGPVRYQWFFNGQPIPGATEPTLEIADITADHLGTYLVRIDDDLDVTPINSSPVQLPDWPLWRTDLKEGRIVIPGDTVTLGPVALFNPHGEVTHQWYFNDQPIAGATTDTLTIGPLVPDQFGTYHVRVSDARHETPVASSRIRVDNPY